LFFSFYFIIFVKIEKNMNCAKCSKKNGLYYDEKSKMFFCHVHKHSDLTIVPKTVKKPKTKKPTKK
jgi:hypothetical protein